MPASETIDYPAAHSMDTEWFAVDADGNVGLFNSYEDGAVPLRAATLGGAGEASFDAAVFYASLAVRALAAGTWQAANEDRAWLAEAKPTRVLIVAREAPPGDFIEVSTTPWAGVSRGPIALAPLAALPGVVAIVPAQDLYDLADRTDLFVFSREHGDDPGLYNVSSAPAKPLRVDDLPRDIRGEVGSVTLATTFSSAPVHLGDHLKDDEAGYWGTDWTLRGFGNPATKPPVATLLPRATSRAALVVIALIVAVLVVIRILRG